MAVSLTVIARLDADYYWVEHPWIRVVRGAARDGSEHRSDMVKRCLDTLSAGSTRSGGGLGKPQGL
ncbi:MAG TPA: hypothetical protein DCE36_11735 [Pseudomonas sp.]|nr:hypothetical protein BB029_11250 [Pseudomonas sp. S3E12]HAA40737.1 hypothetical protein [Pseudomonas sp.]